MPTKTPSGKQSVAWKNLERQVAKALKGRRVLRGSDFSHSDVDVILDDLPELRLDAKFRVKHSHHKFMRELVARYCQAPGQEPVLITKTHHQKSAFVTIRLELFALLVDALRYVGEEKDG